MFGTVGSTINPNTGHHSGPSLLIPLAKKGREYMDKFSVSTNFCLAKKLSNPQSQFFVNDLGTWSLESDTR